MTPDPSPSPAESPSGAADSAPPPDGRRRSPRPSRVGTAPPRAAVERATAELLAAIERGDFLPGDQLVLDALHRRFGISSTPAREATRILEGQGVVSFPNLGRGRIGGAWVVPLTNESVGGLMRVRLALEAQAADEAVAAAERLGRARVWSLWGPLREAVDRLAALGGDAPAAEAIAADRAFHDALCVASGNEALLGVWRALAGRLAILWSLGRRNRTSVALAAEHAAVLAALEGGDTEATVEALTVHLSWHLDFDFEAEIAARRRARGEAAPEASPQSPHDPPADAGLADSGPEAPGDRP